MHTSFCLVKTSHEGKITVNEGELVGMVQEDAGDDMCEVSFSKNGFKPHQA